MQGSTNESEKSVLQMQGSTNESEKSVLQIVGVSAGVWAVLFALMVFLPDLRLFLKQCPWVIGAILLLSPTIALALVIWGVTKVSHAE